MKPIATKPASCSALRSCSACAPSAGLASRRMRFDADGWAGGVEEPRKRDVSDVDRKDRKKENRGDHTQE